MLTYVEIATVAHSLGLEHRPLSEEQTRALQAGCDEFYARKVLSELGPGDEKPYHIIVKNRMQQIIRDPFAATHPVDISAYTHDAHMVFDRETNLITFVKEHPHILVDAINDHVRHEVSLDYALENIELPFGLEWYDRDAPPNGIISMNMKGKGFPDYEQVISRLAVDPSMMPLRLKPEIADSNRFWNELVIPVLDQVAREISTTLGEYADLVGDVGAYGRSGGHWGYSCQGNIAFTAHKHEDLPDILDWFAHNITVECDEGGRCYLEYGSGGIEYEASPEGLENIYMDYLDERFSVERYLRFDDPSVHRMATFAHLMNQARIKLEDPSYWVAVIKEHELSVKEPKRGKPASEAERSNHDRG
jgi:hypothetical protein